MGRKTSLVSLKEISEINMTPLMDLTFILLITFMITFPLIEKGVNIDLPKGGGKPLDAARTHSLTLDANNKLYLDEQPLERAELSAEMRSIAATDPATTIYVRADEKIAYGKVAAVLKLLKDAEISRTALVMEEEQP